MKRVLRLFLPAILFFIIIEGLPDATFSFAYTDKEIDDKLSELNSKLSAAQVSSEASATVSGDIFIGYVNDMTDGSKKNYFEVSRAYLDVKKNLDRNCSVRLTTDVERFSTFEADTRYSVYLKYAYFDISNLAVPYIGLNTLRIGQSGTHWIDFSQNFWTFRFVAKPLTDYFKVFDSADLGLAALGKIGQFDYHVTLMNGGGFKNDETSANNYGKTAAIRINTDAVRFSDKDKITAGVGYSVKEYPFEVGSHQDYDKLESVLSVLAGWNFTSPASGVVFIEGFGKKNAGSNWNILSTGMSLGGRYQIARDILLFGRIDNYQPSANDDISQEKNLNIFGLEYDWGKNVRLALDQQLELKEAHKKDKFTWNIHTEVKW
jgi:hypothetical protein